MPIPTLGKVDRMKQRGATLLEVIIAMVIIAMVAAGSMSAFVFGRQVTWRSGTELSAAGLTKQTIDALRMAVGANAPNGLSLQPGIYVDPGMGNAPVVGGNNPIPLPALSFPVEFVRFQTNGGTAATINGHGDGRLVVVENSPQDNNPANGQIDPAELQAVDLDGDGLAGIDFDGDGVTDLRRVRVRVRWTSPSA